MPCIFSFFFKKIFVVNDVKTFAQIDEAQQRDLPLSVGARIWSDNDSNAVSVRVGVRAWMGTGDD